MQINVIKLRQTLPVNHEFCANVLLSELFQIVPLLLKLGIIGIQLAYSFRTVCSINENKYNSYIL